jgi:hypothetical protein
MEKDAMRSNTYSEIMSVLHLRSHWRSYDVFFCLFLISPLMLLENHWPTGMFPILRSLVYVHHQGPPGGNRTHDLSITRHDCEMRTLYDGISYWIPVLPFDIKSARFHSQFSAIPAGIMYDWANTPMCPTTEYNCLLWQTETLIFFESL